MKEEKILYFDIIIGISGDMTLSTLLNLGVPKEIFLEELSKLNLNDEFEIEINDKFENGIKGTNVNVITKENHVHRNLIDIYDIIEHSSLNDDIKENAKKNFKGTIDFKKGCKKAKGNENEFCMLLSEKAKSLALPMLLCTEDDVEGNHSTASGKVDKEQLFYIMTRGLSYKEAVKLIVRANFNKTIERILDEEVKQNIIKEIDERLD